MRSIAASARRLRLAACVAREASFGLATGAPS